MPSIMTRVNVSLNPAEPDGIVVEGPGGVRLVAIPTAVLDILKFADTIQYTREGHVYRMRVGLPRPGGVPLQPTPTTTPAPSPTTPPPADRAEYGLADAWQCRNPKCGWYNVSKAAECGECGTPKDDPETTD